MTAFMVACGAILWGLALFDALAAQQLTVHPFYFGHGAICFGLAALIWNTTAKDPGGEVEGIPAADFKRIYGDTKETEDNKK